MSTLSRFMTRATYGFYGAVAVCAAASQANAAVPVADSPLFLTVAVPPNITLTLDDSGSMAKAFVPDICGTSGSPGSPVPNQYDCGVLDTRHAKSAHFNPLYYNPNVKYPVPKTATGTDMTTSFTAAYRNGFHPTGGLGTRNLSNGYRPTAYLDFPPGSTNGTEGYANHYSGDVQCTGSSPYMCQIRSGPSSWFTTTTACTGSNSSQRNNSCRSNDAFPVPAYYYVFNTTNTGCTATDRTDDDCYDIVHVSSTSGLATEDLNGDGVEDSADSDERQNFANWYSFARTRHLATQTAASLAFADLDPDVRVAWQALNTCRNSSTSLVDTDCDGWRNNMSNVSNAIRPFTGTHKSNFYTWLAQLPTNDTTPLPDAMYRVGEYYRTSGENSPYDNDFTTNNSGELACRRNYHVMMTDGIWNTARASSNSDGTSTALPETDTASNISQYTPTAPYGDTHSNTLADLAFQYWATDLRGSLDNNLLRNYRSSTNDAVVDFWNPRNDPATWQHMVNFTIGLGLTDFLSQEGLTWGGNMYLGSYPSIADGTTAWPQPASNDPANVADLWHAAINSRGQFFSADDPASLSIAFRAALNAITDASGSSAALSANSTSLTGTTLVYQAKFNDDWSGALLALPVGTGGAVSQIPEWDASALIPAHSSRQIFTHNESNGVAFSSCTALSAAQRTALNTNSVGVVDNLCDERLAWLRGDRRNEVSSTTASSLHLFRNRPNTVMGDIINSDPAYVKDVDYGYSGLPSGTPGQASYDSYRTANANRIAMVYVGSNDGRMYAIRGDAGAADSGVEQFSYIPAGVYGNLSYLTDPSYAHRYYADGSIIARDAYIGGAWQTVVVAGLNAGGRSIYALNVTDPQNFDAADVMWEFDPSDDADANGLGLTFSKPQLGVLESGQWVAIFGNGYSSPSGGAHLYIVDLATGSLLRRITASDTAGDESNGLSTPALVDADGDKMIDTVYAGDLHGNLWKFDLSGTQASWGVANGRPLFTAEIGSRAQPITAQPKFTSHPSSGLLIYFGTGRYLTNSDVFDTNRQSYYGIWDNGSWTTTASRSDLQVQTIDLQTDVSGREVRSVSSNTVDWASTSPELRGWYIDLVDGTGSGSELGERVVNTSLVIRDLVIFATIIPSTDPCVPGGTSWVFALKYDNGGSVNRQLFDLDGDGTFDSSVGDEFVNAVKTPRLGITNVPVLIVDDPTPDDPTDDPTASADTGYLIGTGTTGETETNRICLNVNGCGTSPPTSSTVIRRSWIQIR